VLVTRGTGQKTPVTVQDVISALRPALKSTSNRVGVIDTNPSSRTAGRRGGTRRTPGAPSSYDIRHPSLGIADTAAHRPRRPRWLP
jgi:hypothetical protein